MQFMSFVIIVFLMNIDLWRLVMPMQTPWNSTGEKVTSKTCLEPKSTGLCRGKLLRYAYDDKTKNCISFYYSGCGATQNNFLTYEECRRECILQFRYQ